METVWIALMEAQMRIVVMSDSHGDSRSVEELIAREHHADGFVHLGDGARDWIYTVPGSGQFLIGVRGNGDFGVALPLILTEDWEGKKFFCCHGHTFRVKMGLYELQAAASQIHADVILYGHTHIPDIERQGDRLLICPGSINAITGRGSYAVVTVEKDKVDASIYLL